jgi:hypothetical protein
LALLLLAAKVQSQKLYCEKVQSYPQIRFSQYFTPSTHFLFQQDTIFHFSAFKVSIFKPGQKKNELDLEKLLSKSQKKMIRPAYSFSYFLSRDTLIIRNQRNVFVFTYNHQRFSLRDHFTLKQKFGDKIYLNHNTIYFYGIYDHFGADFELASGYLAYDLANKKEKVLTFPFQEIAITHLGPNKFIDFSGTSYMICDPLRYRLYMFDLHDQLQDSISLPDSLFKVSPVKDFVTRFDVQKMGTGVVDHLDDMRAYVDTVDRIWMIHYINDSTLYVRLTRNSLRGTNKKGQLFYDHVWLRKDRKWTLIEIKDLNQYDPEKPIGKESLWPYFFPGSKYTCNNGTLYFTCWSSSSDTFPQTINQLSGFDATNRDLVCLKLITFRLKHE